LHPGHLASEARTDRVDHGALPRLRRLHGQHALDDEHGGADPDLRPSPEQRRLLDAVAVHERPVRGSQVLHLKAVGVPPYYGVAARELQIIDRHVGVLTSDHELLLNFDRLAGQRPADRPQSCHQPAP
jgi:hypothetical protein